MRPRGKFLLEVCVDSVASAIAAQRGGAHRVELCSDIAEGGITPSLGLIELVRKNIAIDLHVLIRPRGGGFCYSAAELNVILRDIEHAKACGASGVVIGVLKSDSTFDLIRMRELIKASRPMSVTIHRAFDVCKRPFDALERLIDTGATAILTSGQAKTAIEGVEFLTKLNGLAAGRIEIIAAGKLTAGGIAMLRKKAALTSFHIGSAVYSCQHDGKPDGLFSSGNLRVVDPAKVASVLAAQTR